MRLLVRLLSAIRIWRNLADKAGSLQMHSHLFRSQESGLLRPIRDEANVTGFLKTG